MLFFHCTRKETNQTIRERAKRRNWTKLNWIELALWSVQFGYVALHATLTGKGSDNIFISEWRRKWTVQLYNIKRGLTFRRKMTCAIKSHDMAADAKEKLSNSATSPKTLVTLRVAGCDLRPINHRNILVDWIRRWLETVPACRRQTHCARDIWVSSLRRHNGLHRSSPLVNQWIEQL